MDDSTRSVRLQKQRPASYAFSQSRQRNGLMLYNARITGAMAKRSAAMLAQRHERALLDKKAVLGSRRGVREGDEVEIFDQAIAVAVADDAVIGKFAGVVRARETSLETAVVNDVDVAV